MGASAARPKKPAARQIVFLQPLKAPVSAEWKALRDGTKSPPALFPFKGGELERNAHFSLIDTHSTWFKSFIEWIFSVSLCHSLVTQNRKADEGRCLNYIPIKSSHSAARIATVTNSLPNCYTADVIITNFWYNQPSFLENQCMYHQIAIQWGIGVCGICIFFCNVKDKNLTWATAPPLVITDYCNWFSWSDEIGPGDDVNLSYTHTQCYPCGLNAVFG